MTGYWETNLAALADSRDRRLRAFRDQLTHRGPGPDLGLRSRTGTILPGVVSEGKGRSLISTFDPFKEAARWASGGTGSTTVVFGGGGVAAARALSDRGVPLTFWVEPRIEVWQSLFTWEDWTERIVSDQWVPVWEPEEQWPAVLLNRYHPLWDGGLQTLDWRPATQGAEERWDGYRKGTVTALETLGSDFSTQAKFGERWYRNTLVNLRRLQSGTVPGCPGARVVVAGAGPGLDDALDSLATHDWLANRTVTGDRLFSTDTALPALSSRGIVPDLVFCLDGQLPSYHHFVPPRPRGVPLVADLAAMPFLSRVGMPVVRFLTNHPFEPVIRRFFPEIPYLDGSLGNVSGLAWYTAWALGAASVETWGVDFSYRDGQAYARGTYVYDTAARRATRLHPCETLLGGSDYGAYGLVRTRDDRGRAIDSTPLLREYRQRWSEAVPPKCGTVLAHGDSTERWFRFFRDWENRLKTMPMPPVGVPFHPFVRDLPLDRRQDWVALWPLALAIHRQGIPPQELPEAVVARALGLLQDCFFDIP